MLYVRSLIPDNSLVAFFWMFLRQFCVLSYMGDTAMLYSMEGNVFVVDNGCDTKM